MEEKIEENTKENSESPVENGDDAKMPESVRQANDVAKRLEEATEAQRIENNRREDLNSRNILGGNSEAGKPNEKPVEETNKEYNDRIEKEVSEGKHDE